MLRVRNFEKFQHYKDRSPPWIKLYGALLDDYEFAQIPDASKAHLILLWLLASKLDNAIPDDPAWIARRLPVTEPIDIEGLVAAGFLDRDAEAVPARKHAWASRYVSTAVREAVLAMTGGKCARCKSARDVEIDHIVPISAGGTSDPSNLQPLCRKCNRSKRVRATRYLAEQDAPQMRNPETETEGETETDLPPSRKPREPRPSGKTTWLTPIGEAWEAENGKGSFTYGQAAKELKPLVDAGHTPEFIARCLAWYLRVRGLDTADPDPEVIKRTRFTPSLRDFRLRFAKFNPERTA